MWFYLVLILFLILLTALLFIPIELIVDTDRDEYAVRLKGIATARLEGHEEELLRVKMNVFFLKFYFYPLRKKRSVRKKEKEKPDRKKKVPGISLRRVMKILKSFQIKGFAVDVDTGNCISNAKLYPLFAFVNFYSNARLQVNFEGRNRMFMHIRNRPLNLIRSFIV